MEPVIRLNQVSFAYHNDTLFDKLSLSVEQGDFVALIGPNGAGKSTLLKLITGVIQPLEGTVSLFGVEMKKFSYWHKIGYVPQNPGKQHQAFPATVTEIVKMGLTRPTVAFHRHSRRDKQAVQESLEMVDMWSCRDRLIGELSGGQQQRVFVAKALVGNPDLLLLDEPATGIDADAKRNLYQLLSTFNHQAGITIVMVSHDVEMAMKVAKHVLCVDRGVCFWGTGPEVMGHNRTHGLLYESRRVL